MEPLANKIRPKNLSEFVGQDHLVGAGKPLRQAIEGKHLFSFVLWGPPGVGKTTIARIYAEALDARLYELSAVSAGKEDIKKIIEEPDNLLDSRPKLLFLDEIHRFNKAQQDFLLPYVESGRLTLIGATTENPFFSVNSALVSRSQIFQFEPLGEPEVRSIVLAAPTTGRRAVSSVRGELDEAFRWLDKAHEVHDAGLALVLVNPALDGMRADPRWLPFAKRLGLLATERWRNQNGECGKLQEDSTHEESLSLM